MLVASIVLLQIISCQKPLSDESVVTPPALPLVDLTTKVASSVSGFVTDDNDAAVQSATVKVGSQVVSTDEYGYFEVKNTQVVKNAATVSVTLSGYFPGIRTYIAEDNKSAFVRIKLIPKVISGTISSSSGGTVTLTTGLKIALPANAVVNALTGSAYDGAVSVAASWINPAAADLDRIMPGDLRALDAGGEFKQLVTYGMAAVELTGTGGEKLQVAPGKKASLSFPILLAQAGSAPGNIPLWYFDEAAGLWKEEGKAVKNGSNYEGEVSHFSFWNCDIPENFVQVNLTVKDDKGRAVPFAHVKITRMDKSNTAGYGYTDSSGYVGGAVPANAQLKLEIFTSYACSTPLFTQTFTTATSTFSLGVITINTSQGSAIVSGTATTCNSTPVTNGFIIMKKGNEYSRYPVSNTGTFQFTTFLCNNTGTSVELIGEDVAAGQQGTPSTKTIVSGTNAIGNLQACGVTTEQFVNLTINGVTYNYSAPADSITLRPNSSGPIYTAYGVNAFRMASPNQPTDFKWTGQPIAVGSMQTLYGFGTPYINDSTTIMNTINVNITEVGAIGQFLSGNFSGILRGGPPTNTNYNISCSFRVRRYF